MILLKKIVLAISFFTQDYASMLGVVSVTSRGIHVWHMLALAEIFANDSVLQFGDK